MLQPFLFFGTNVPVRTVLLDSEKADGHRSPRRDPLFNRNVNKPLHDSLATPSGLAFTGLHNFW